MGLTYHLTTVDLSAKPVKVLRLLAPYAVAGRMQSGQIMSDGEYGSPGRVIFFGTAAGLGLAAGLGGAFAVAPLFGLLADLLRAQPGKRDDAPAPAAQWMMIEFTNVGDKRAVWAELLLCHAAKRSGWHVTSTLLDDRNLAYAASARRMPAPWAGRNGLSGKGSALRWLWGCRKII